MEHDITSKWYLIVINDPNFLRSDSLISVVESLKTIMPFNYVILNDVQGTGASGMIEGLQKLENEPIEIDKILKWFLEVKSFEWCDLFLFCKAPQTWDNPNDYEYPNLIQQTDTTVRCVDGQYIYIYTPHDIVLDAVKDKFTVESVSHDILNKLDYPY